MSTSPKRTAQKVQVKPVDETQLNKSLEIITRAGPALNHMANGEGWFIREKYRDAASLAVIAFARLSEAEKELVKTKEALQRVEEQLKLTAKEANSFKDTCKAELTKRHAALVEDLDNQKNSFAALQAQVDARDAIIEQLQGSLTDSQYHIEKLKKQADELRKNLQASNMKAREAESELNATKRNLVSTQAEMLAYKDKLEELYEILGQALGKNVMKTTQEQKHREATAWFDGNMVVDKVGQTPLTKLDGHHVEVLSPSEATRYLAENNKPHEEGRLTTVQLEKVEKEICQRLEQCVKDTQRGAYDEFLSQEPRDNWIEP
jgi:chromosome segregation ATPase